MAEEEAQRIAMAKFDEWAEDWRRSKEPWPFWYEPARLTDEVTRVAPLSQPQWSLWRQSRRSNDSSLWNRRASSAPAWREEPAQSPEVSQTLLDERQLPEDRANTDADAMDAVPAETTAEVSAEVTADSSPDTAEPAED